MALDQQAKSFVANKFGTTPQQIDSLSAIPGFSSELERGFEVFKDGMSSRIGGMVNGGLGIMSSAIKGASSDPIGFVKTAMRYSVYNGQTDLLKQEIAYLQKNNIPVEDIKSLYTGYATEKANNDAAYAAAQQGGGGFFGDVGKFFASIDPSTAVSKAATNLFQPVEKAVTTAVSDVSKALSTPDAQKALGIAAAYFLPGVGAQLGQQLVAQGLITGAAIPYATAIGTALAQTGVGVAQGQPLDTALTNATVNAVTSTGAPGVAGYISKLGASPQVANAITSVGASGLATAAKGGSAADIEKNMTGALAGSTVTGLTGDKLSGAVVGGAITGGAVGAATGAAGALGAPKTDTGTTGKDPGVNVAGGDDAAALEIARISALPEMLGREGEKSSPITTTTEDGITLYKRSVTGTTSDGKPYGYVVTYDPGAPQGKQFQYETGYVIGPDDKLVDPSGGGGVKVTFSKPTFDAQGQPTTGTGSNLTIISDTSGKANVGGAGGGSLVSPTDKKIIDVSGIGSGNVAVSGGGVTGNASVGGAGTGTGTGTGTEPRAGTGAGTGVGTGAGTGAGGGGGTGTGGVKEEPPKKEPEEEPKKEPEIISPFIYTGVSPKTKISGRQTTQLGTTLQAPFYPTSTLGQALTGYRGAGEIEGKKTGKPRRDVWNEESLRLKDALGL